MIILQGARERVGVLQFSPAGHTLVAPCSEGVQVWHDLIGGSSASLLNYRGVQSVRFSPDGVKLLLFGRSGKVVHDLPTGGAVAVRMRWPGLMGYGDVSPDGKFLVASQSGWVRCWPLADLESPLWTTDPPVPGSSVRPLFLGNGERFVLAELRPAPSGSWWVYVIRETQTGAVWAEGPAPEVPFSDPVQSSDRRLLAALRGIRAWVWRTDDLFAPPKAFRNDNRKEFTGLAFHPSGRFLAATSNDNTLKLYDTATLTVAKAFNFDIGKLRSIGFSPDGMLAAVGGDRGKIVVWDVDL
jgi:WD40 repeat protein